MAWSFKRQLPNEEYIPLFRKWCAAYEQTVADAGTAPRLEGYPGYPIPAMLKEFDTVLPQYKPYRPIHRALIKLAWAQATALRCFAEVEAIQNTAKTLRELGEGKKASQCEKLTNIGIVRGHEAAQLIHELDRRLEALPESDPIRLIYNS